MCHPGPADPATHVVPTVRGHRVPVRVHQPQIMHAGVVLIPDYFGFSAFYGDLAARLVDRNLLVAVTDLYAPFGAAPQGDADAAGQRLDRIHDTQVMGDLADVLAWTRDKVPSGRLGCLGFCAGGTWALSAAVDHDDIVVVAFYGFPDGNPGAATRRRPLQEIAKLRAPALAVWGEDDTVAGSDQVAAYCAAADTSSLLTANTIPGQAHGFLRGLHDPDIESRKVAQATWDGAIDFLGHHNVGDGAP